MPSGVVPTGMVNIDETSYKDNIGDAFESYANQAMKESAGMPTGVQIIGWPNQDEQVLRVMRELQEKVKFKLPMKFDN